MRFAAASLLLLALLAPAQAPTTVTAAADAVRLNNLGVASMNQQKFEVALKSFQDASARDQGLTAATVNQAVALLALQRYEPAQQVLETAVKADDRNVRAWYNLGLLQKGLGNADAALAAFTRVTELLPSDPHAHYFVGLIASQLQQYDKAIPAFTKALEIDAYLVSAEFGLARAYQRSGKPDDAKTHMNRFTRITQEKVASAMSLAYGDQGKLSLAEALRPPVGATAPIHVSFVVDDKTLRVTRVRDRIRFRSGGCELDADGDGAIDYVRLGPSGAQLLRNTGKGQLASPVTLTADPGVSACTVADYDNDERPDIAIASAERVWLFHNDGEGKFSDATSKAGLPASVAGGAARSLAFIDVDHDADVDLVVTAAKTVLLRNNGNGTFADVTEERGFAIANTAGVIASDLNNDRAIDVVLTGETTSILLNPREGAFKRLDAFKPAAPANTLRRRRSRLRQGRLDGPGVHLGRCAGRHALAQCERDVVQARRSSGLAHRRRLRHRRHRLRQRRLGRPGRRGQRANGGVLQSCATCRAISRMHRRKSERRR